ncbi:hypothetical protein ACFFWC_13475 [Plantactinospora siamensis]|uniref:Tetratricopeptide repeat protein n=1 Tax=Plantactinospora siamensis TaxID=555372 RepID=A0ABV6P4F9_9ACTN
MRSGGRTGGWDVERPESWDWPAPHRADERSRTAGSALPVPRPGRWLIAAVLLSLALLALSYLAGDGVVKPPRWAPDRVWPVVSGLVQGVLAGARTMLFATGDLRWRQLGLLLVALLTYLAWRHWRQSVFAYRPGPIDIRKFENADPGDEGCAIYLRSRFCRQLADTDIYPPYAGPSDPPPQGFMDALAKEGDSTSLPGTMMSFVGKLWPRSGYFVTATLQERRPEPKYGLSITVTSLLGRSRSTTSTQWGASWEDATCKAAYWTMAKILPATRLSRRPPWRKWFGRDMPAELFECYNEAKKRHDEQKLDDALWWYREALRLDPFNINIRMMVASVQEDLGLFLDALQTYEAALTVVELENRYTGNLWSRKRYRLWRPWRFAWSTLRLLHHHPEWIRLRYQYARALGYTDRVARDWFPDRPGAPGSERHRVHDQAQQRLCAALAERYWPAVLDVTPQDGAKDHVRLLLAHSATARILLALAAWQEFHRLYEDATLPWLAPGVDTGVHRRLLRLMRDVWAPLRLMEARSGYDPETGRLFRAPRGFDLRDADCLPDWWVRYRRAKARRVLDVGWPVDPDLLERRINQVQRRWNPFESMNHLDY